MSESDKARLHDNAAALVERVKPRPGDIAGVPPEQPEFSAQDERVEVFALSY